VDQGRTLVPWTRLKHPRTTASCTVDAVTTFGLDLAGVLARSFITGTIFNCVDIMYAYVEPPRESAAQPLRATPRPEPPSSPRSITMPSTIRTIPVASTPPVAFVNSFWAIA
jgi:hypothetical protein